MAKNQFCACGHNRSFTFRSQPNICGDPPCECVKHDTAKADPREARTVAGTDPVDSHLLDRVLMAGALEHLQARIKNATRVLKMGLHYQSQGNHHHAGLLFKEALQHLGDLGAS